MSWNESMIGDLSGHNVVITGANSGVGFEAARQLVRHGAHVVLACRNVTAAEQAQTTIAGDGSSGSTEIVELDLSDLNSVTRFAAGLLNDGTPIDALVNNAGVMGGPERFTAQGFEMQMGTNHLGHFALTAQLWPLIVAAENPRVLSLSSIASRNGSLTAAMTRDTLVAPKPYKEMAVYSNTKQATLLFSQELSRRAQAAGLNVSSIGVHPGVSATNLVNRQLQGRGLGVLAPVASGFGKVLFQSAKGGARPTVMATTDSDVVSGDFVGSSQFGQVRGAPKVLSLYPQGRDAATASKLWELSEQIVEVPFDLRSS
ncbi:MAG: oxidoreductase [Candidatus Nanopelagicales bacterium]